MFTANYKNKLNETIENAIFVLGFYINYVVCELDSASINLGSPFLVLYKLCGM